MPQPQEKITKLVSGDNPAIEATITTVGSYNALPVLSVDSTGNIAATGINGGNISVGTTAVEMTFTGTTKALQIQSDQDNTGAIWVGPSNVTSAGVNAYARLSPGQAITFELDDASAAIYAISDTSSQTIYKVALT